MGILIILYYLVWFAMGAAVIGGIIWGVATAFIDHWKTL